jgi:hypothetical protein
MALDQRSTMGLFVGDASNGLTPGEQDCRALLAELRGRVREGFDGARREVGAGPEVERSCERYLQEAVELDVFTGTLVGLVAAAASEMEALRDELCARRQRIELTNEPSPSAASAAASAPRASDAACRTPRSTSPRR